MQNFDLNEISVFVKVAQTGSFTRAANQLEMPNSTVSTRVSSLEKRLGVTLLQRTTRQLKLTKAGQEYFEKCLAGLEEIYRAETEVTSKQEEPQGEIKITAPIFLGNNLLPKILTECSKKYPKLNVEVILNDKSLNLVSENIDLAIRAGELKDSVLIARKIATLYFAPYASPSYLKKYGEPKHPKSLRDHQCILFSPLGREDWPLYNDKNRVNVTLVKKWIVDDLTLAKSLATGGNGITLLPTFACDEEIKKRQLVRILPEWRSSPRQIQFVHLPQKFPSPKFKAFYELALESAKAQLSSVEDK
jgi:DNA-binding transcriptional LysR family regulator